MNFIHEYSVFSLISITLFYLWFLLCSPIASFKFMSFLAIIIVGIPIYPVESHQYYLYILQWRADYLGVGKLAGSFSQKKKPGPSLVATYCLQLFNYGWGLCALPPPILECWLVWSCVGKHYCQQFMGAVQCLKFQKRV